MIKKILFLLLFLAIALAILDACNTNNTSSGNTSSGSTVGVTSTSGTTAAAGANGSSGSVIDVHMTNQTFVVSSITLPKGDSLKLVDDVGVPHHIGNGTWVNGTAQQAREAGAPAVDAQFNGNDSQTVGPFNTAGTYHLYCSYHPGMNLLVVVQ